MLIRVEILRDELELLLAKQGRAPIFAPLFPFMDILIGILTAVEVIVCLLLILVVLMQRPRQEGLGASFGDAAASQVWGAQTTNVLQKFTVYLAIILFAITLLLAVLVSRKQAGGKSEKIYGDAKPAAAAPAAKADDKKPTEAPKAEPQKTAEPSKAETQKVTESAKAPAKAPTTPPAKAPAAPAKASATPPAPAKTQPAPQPAASPAPAPAAPATQPK